MTEQQTPTKVKLSEDPVAAPAKPIVSAAYTIMKNEMKNLDRWIKKTQIFNYRIVLDTGSTDGTYEKLQELAKTDPALIVAQEIFDEFDFSKARNAALKLIPQDVTWCFAPDADEFFSKNVLDNIKYVIAASPTTTLIACDRLDLHSYYVRASTDTKPALKIHVPGYLWEGPVHEELVWQLGSICQPVVNYTPDVYLIHDFDEDQFRNKIRFYHELMEKERTKNVKNIKNLWYLMYFYQVERDLTNFVRVGIDFLDNATFQDERYRNAREVLESVVEEPALDPELKEQLKIALIPR